MATQNESGIREVEGALLTSYTQFTAFTPVIAGSRTAGVGTYTTQAGSYYKVGKIVFVNVNFTWTAHTGTGNMRIAGLPFTSFNNATFAPIFPLLLANIALVSGAVGVVGQVNTNATTADLLIVRSNVETITQVSMDSSGTLIASMVYQTA